MKPTISWNDFEKIDFRCGTIIQAEIFKEAKKPAYILHVDFGEELGVKKSSAQITELYQPEDLVGMQVLAVVNFVPKQIGPIQSQCLVCGFYTPNGVVLANPQQQITNGSQLG